MRVDPNEGGKVYPRLSQDDLEADAAVLTVAGFEQRSLPNGDIVRELFFSDADKPLRLNKTQLKYLIEGLGTDESDSWKGCIVPIEKVTKEGPDGKLHDTVWISSPESCAGLFRESGLKVPRHQKQPTTRTVAPVAAIAPKRGRPAGKAVKRSGRK